MVRVVCAVWRVLGHWWCPVAGCRFTAVYPTSHPCPLKD